MLTTEGVEGGGVGDGYGLVLISTVVGVAKITTFVVILFTYFLFFPLTK